MAKRVKVTPHEILQALRDTAGQKSAAANLLGVSVQTLRRRLNDNPKLKGAWETELAASYRERQKSRRPNQKPRPLPKRLRVCTRDEQEEFLRELSGIINRRRPNPA